MSEIDKIQLKDAIGQLIAEYDLSGGSSSDTKVTQTETTTDAEYEILFSGTADNTTRTEGAGKSEGMTYNPNYGSLMVGLRHPGSAIGSESMGVGHGVTTSGNGSFATGTGTVASGSYSHAEGGGAVASGYFAHAEGGGSTASGDTSHAEGGGTTASGSYSHAEGGGTVAKNAYQHVFGMYNVPDPSANSSIYKGNYVEIVGNGTVNGDTINTSNARTLDWQGNETLKGNLTVGGTSITVNGKTVAHSGNVGTGDSNGQVKIAGTNVSVKGLGSRAYDSTAYLPLAGGTMTGSIIKKYSDISISANPSVNKYYTPIIEQDKNGNSIGFIGCCQYTNGIIGERIYCTRKVGSNTIYNGIQLSINNAGARLVYLDDAGVWRSALGINTGYNGSWFNKYVSVGGDGVIEIGRYIDFHQTNAHSGDYTFRFSNNGNNTLQASGSITQGSSRKIKENIKDMTEEEALKILELNPVSFDYIEEYGGGKDNRGFIAEDVVEILPNLTTPEDGDIEDMKHFSPMSLNYTGIIPYLVKVIQIQEKRISELESKLN